MRRGHRRHVLRGAGRGLRVAADDQVHRRRRRAVGPRDHSQAGLGLRGLRGAMRPAVVAAPAGLVAARSGGGHLHDGRGPSRGPPAGAGADHLEAAVRLLRGRPANVDDWQDGLVLRQAGDGLPDDPAAAPAAVATAPAPTAPPPPPPPAPPPLAPPALTTTPCPINCDEGYNDLDPLQWVRGWSGAKKIWCCKTAHRGCPSELPPPSGQPPSGLPPEPDTSIYDCDAGYHECMHCIREAWSQAKIDYCCREEHRACAGTIPE